MKAMRNMLIEKLNKSLEMENIKGNIKKNHALAGMTWFKVGGNAEVFFQPEDVSEMQKFLRILPKKIPLQVLGAGSNILVRDGGIDGVVLNLGKRFSNINIGKDFFVSVGAGANCIKLARDLAELEIKGLEFFSGIPGTIGGAIKMNAGAYKSQTSDRLVSIKSVDRDGNTIELEKKDYTMEYRRTNFPDDLIFYEATFSCESGRKKELLDKISVLNEKRTKTQPIKKNTGGSTFKNPTNNKAWKLIKESGCSQLKIGGAYVSELHSNFIVNNGNASSSDIEQLGEEIKKRVRNKSGINLEWEIHIVGKEKKSKEVLYD